MINSGYVEVQNHTYDLHSINSDRFGCMQCSTELIEEYEKVLTYDILKLQDEIYRETRKMPNTFTYPYGKSSKNTEETLKKLGFKATLSCNDGINKITNDPENLFGLKRICRSHGDTMEELLGNMPKQ